MSSPAIPEPSKQQPAAPSTPPRGATAAGGAEPTVAELFAAFAAISLSGFGGVLAWARRKMVEERGWRLTAEQFNEVYALCAFLPGVSSISPSSSVHACAARRALAAIGGPLGPPMVLIIVVGAIFAHYGDVPALRRMLTGVAAAAAGLMIATVAKMARPLFRNRAVVGPLIALSTFGAIGVMHWPLPLVLAAIVPASIGAAWVRL
jgi:chromate transporter